MTTLVCGMRGRQDGRWDQVANGPLELLHPSDVGARSHQAMSLEPKIDPREKFAHWRFEAPARYGFTALGLMAPATPNKACEDAPPIFSYLKDSNATSLLAGVFDGMGGAGSKIVETPSGASVTQAYLASRVIRDVYEHLWWTSGASNLSPAVVTNELSRALESVKRRLGNSATSRLMGSMVKEFPSTLATVQCRSEGRDAWHVHAQWAGDSRIYILNTSRGLQQVSVDDVEEQDPLEQVRGDFRLQNVISVSSAFNINASDIYLNKPALVLVATDGLYHSLPTPGSLEYIILSSLQNSESETALRLTRTARQVANDDVSFVLLALGFDKFEEIRLAFRGRYAALEAGGYRRLLSMTPGEDATVALADSFWERERQNYVELMGHR